MDWAKSRASRFSHATSVGGYSKPAPGPDMMMMAMGAWDDYNVERKIWVLRIQMDKDKSRQLLRTTVYISHG